MQFDVEQVLGQIRDPTWPVVSFDVFDTLLRRRLMDPNHLFWLLERVLLRRGYDYRWVRHVGHARTHAWLLAIRYAQLRGRQDTNFDEIYRLLGSVLPQAHPHLTELQQLELDLERALIEGYPLGKKLFDAALNAGKRVVVTSDQYLPKSFIEEKLGLAGIHRYERFFLSGELGVLKATGTLYDWLAIRLGVDRDEILHVGDTEATDYHIAKRKGLEACLVPRSIDLSAHPSRNSAVGRHPSLSSMAAASYLHARADEVGRASDEVAEGDTADLDFLGYALLGPLLIGLSRWIADRLESGWADRVWFLSRDGEGLAKVFALIYPALASKAEYVFASRRLLAYTSGELTAEEVFRHFDHLDTPETIAHTFLQVCLGSVCTDHDACASFGPEERLGEPGVRERVRRVIQHLIRTGALTGTGQSDRVKAYYRQKLGVSRKIAIFDVGWRGNLQRALRRVLENADVEIVGLYLGQIFEAELKKDLIECESFVFDCNFPGENYNDISTCLWVVEYLFASTHLSVVDVSERSGSFLPVFEYATPAKAALIQSGVRLQEAALRFVRDALAWNRSTMLELADQEQLVQVLRDFVARPSPYDGRALVNRHAIIGIDESHGKPLVAPLADPSDRHAIQMGERASAWKAGYWAAVGPEIVQGALAGGFLRRHLVPRLRRHRFVWEPLSRAYRGLRRVR